VIFNKEVGKIIGSLSWLGSIAKNKTNFHGARGMMRSMSSSCNSLFREHDMDEPSLLGSRSDMDRITYENARNTLNSINGIPVYGIPTPAEASGQETTWSKYKREFTVTIVGGLVVSIVVSMLNL